MFVTRSEHLDILFSDGTDEMLGKQRSLFRKDRKRKVAMCCILPKYDVHPLMCRKTSAVATL